MTIDLPHSLLQRCQQSLGADILQTQPISGGDINEARLLKTTKGLFFLKMNRAPFAGDMFAKEDQGLSLLEKTKTIRTPAVIASETTDEGAFLLLEMIETGYRQPGFWENFGRALAALHQCSATSFGLDHNNYIGSLAQPNGYQPTFVDFYIRERLQPQLDLAIDAKELTIKDEKRFHKLYQQLPDICPAEPPALIHGDLWSGNFLVGTNNQPVLIDPSVAYSHRELDLGMSRLFGGFERPFYRAYEEAFPLAPGFEQRLPVYQLYYLLVHVNLFGGGYAGSVRRILDLYT